MDNKEIRFSIIIPYYNIIEGLKRLLPDLAVYDDVQVIVVDDRSDKDVEEFAKVRKEYQAHGILFLENDGVKGAGACRNLGMKYAVGKWILFSDADDYFMADFHQIISEYADASADLIYFKPISVFMNTMEPAGRHKIYEKKIKAYLEDPSYVNELHLKYDVVSPWSKMFSRSYLEEHDIKFAEIMYSNDSYFSTVSAYYASSIEVSDQTIYCLTDREGSLTKATDKEAVQIRFDAFVRWTAFLKKNLSAKDWKALNINAMTRLMILFQQGVDLKTLSGLVWKCIRAGIPFIDMSKLNKKTFIGTFFRIYRSNKKK